MASETRRPRYAFVDALRGLAATAVMLYHFTQGDLAPGFERALGHAALVGAKHGWLGVHVFFVLSGFVIAHSVGERAVTFADAARFAVRRQVRLDPSYWLSLALAVFLPWFFLRIGFQGAPPPPLRVIGAHMLYLQELLRMPAIQPIYWTLAIEVQFYLAFVIALAALRFLPPLAVRALLVLTAVGSLDASMHWRFLHGWFMPYWYLFALGALTYAVTQGHFSKWVHAALLAYVFFQGRKYFRLEPQCGALTAATLTIAGLAGKLEEGLAWAPLQFLGRVSYGIYLLHPAAGGQARWHVGIKVDVASAAGAMTVVLAGAALTFVLAWLLHVAVERPSMNLASRIRWRGASGA
jgi:peptidoglycan/LPS O-acetylase OafA/YrhL